MKNDEKHWKYIGIFLALYGLVWFIIEYIGIKLPMAPILCFAIGVKLILKPQCAA